MTVLLGLPERFASVRQMVLLEVEDDDDWRDMVGDLSPRCGAVLAMPPEDGWTDAAIVSLKRAWDAAKPGRLYGIDVSADGSSQAGRELAQALQPDFVVESTPTPGWPHQWALHGAWCPGPALDSVALGHNLADGAFDFALVDGQSDDDRAEMVVGAVRLAPPDEPNFKVWFAVVDDYRAAQAAVEAGALRLAWRIGSMAWWHRDIGRVPERLRKDMNKAAKLLSAAWLKNNPEADVIVKGWRGGK
ncbi:MAG: hypothetical protein FWD63_07505 [Propionibacteriaceae bacterium]|nr:hypothetical protein [Propionibacteriaceae bacterium]